MDPATNARLAAELCVQNKRVGESAIDMIARYNAGHPMATAPESTREKYVPAVRALRASLESDVKAALAT